MLKIFDLKVGFECNNKCIHCVISDKAHNSKLTTQEIKNMIDDLSDYNQIIITGGEATIRKDIIEITSYIKNKGKLVSLQTNGRKLSDKNFALELTKYVDTFLIALHSYKPEIHDIITTKKGSFKETFTGLKNLYDLTQKERIAVQTVISKLNIYDLHELYSLIQNNFPGVRMNMTYPHPDGDAGHNWQIVVPKFSDIKNQIYECLLDFGDLINTEAIPYCYMMPFIEKINYSDKSMLSNDIFINSFDKGAGGIVGDYKKNQREGYIKSEKCDDCFYNNECCGVWKEYYDIYHNLDLEPISKQKLNISVRTKYFENFENMFFKSFFKYYSEYIPDLHVYVDINYEDHNKDDIEKYKNLAKNFGFSIHFTQRTKEEYNLFPNHYTHMLWKSVDGHCGKVISFDDDIVFHNPGLFDVLSKKLDEKPVVSQKYYGSLECKAKAPVRGNEFNSTPHCIASWMFGVNNDYIKYSKIDFMNKEGNYCDGNDMVGFTMKFYDDIYYIDKELDSFIPSTESVTRYFKHISSRTWGLDYYKNKYDYSILDREKRRSFNVTAK